MSLYLPSFLASPSLTVILRAGFKKKASLAALESFCLSRGLKLSIIGRIHLTGFGGSFKFESAFCIAFKRDF